MSCQLSLLSYGLRQCDVIFRGSEEPESIFGIMRLTYSVEL